MSFNSCVRTLGLSKKLPIAELRALASQYQAVKGMTLDAALRQVVLDKLQLARMEEQKIIELVREQYEAQGGQKRPAPAAPEPVAMATPDPEPAPAPEPEPVAQAEPEPAPAAPAEEVPDTGDDIPRAFFAKVKVPHDVLIEETGETRTIEVPADQALASVREDIKNLQALIRCMKGGA